MPKPELRLLEFRGRHADLGNNQRKITILGVHDIASAGDALGTVDEKSEEQRIVVGDRVNRQKELAGARCLKDFTAWGSSVATVGIE